MKQLILIDDTPRNLQLLGGVDSQSMPFLPNKALARIRTHIELKRPKDHLRKFDNHISEELPLARTIQDSNTKLVDIENSRACFLGRFNEI